MLASPADHIPGGDGWTYELKWDGMRALVRTDDGGRLSIHSRRDADYTSCFPELAPISASLPRDSLLDGEIVVLGPDGRPDFDKLQNRWHRPRPHVAAALARTTPVTLVVFDLLRLEHRCLLNEPYSTRRLALERLALRGSRWFTPASHDAGAELLHASRNLGVEGIVAKRRASVYRPGQRSPDWRKLKNYRTETFLVGGWLETAAGGLEALVVGRPWSSSLTLAGTVELGLARSQRDLLPALRLIASDASPFYGPTPRATRFVQPRLSATVRFIGWSRGVLREASLVAVTLA